MIDENNHYTYEDYPAMGVYAEAIRQSLSDARNGDYGSSIAPEALRVNTNLSGYRPLTNRRNEAKNFFLTKGITQNAFPESVEGTVFNYSLVYKLSVCGCRHSLHSKTTLWT